MTTDADSSAADVMRVPIVIIGGGPVGMSLAMNLDAFGVRSVIVNTEAKPRWHPKGGTQNSRTMEHHRRLGIAGRLRKLGLPADRRTDVVYYTRFNGYELQRLPMPSEDEKRRMVEQASPTDQVPEPILRCNQMHVEAATFEHLRTLPNVVSRFGWQCVDWADEGDGVLAEIEEAGTGRRQSLRGAYIVGCDGGQSTVRRRLGIRYGGETIKAQAYLGGPMVSTYLRVPDLHARIIREPAWQYWTINRDVRSNTLSLNGSDEFLFNTRLNSDQEKPDDELIAKAFRASVGENIGIEIIGHSTWLAGQALVADRFGYGRALLAGDAVHLFTPTGGFGMNTGIDDAANLGWKLAALAQGWGGDGLVASYEIERRPIAIRNTEAAKQLARSVGAVPVGEAIETATPEGETARQAARDFLSTFGREFNSLGVQLGARYDGSPIVPSDGAAPPPDDPIVYTPSSVPGGRAPHLWRGRNDSLFDHFGRGFTLLRFEGAADSGSALVHAADKRGVPLKVLTIKHAEGRDLYGCDLALIRPDQHVAWRGDRLPQDCDQLIGAVTGW